MPAMDCPNGHRVRSHNHRGAHRPKACPECASPLVWPKPVHEEVPDSLRCIGHLKNGRRCPFMRKQDFLRPLPGTVLWRIIEHATCRRHRSQEPSQS
jgi:hypothetical protein